MCTWWIIKSKIVKWTETIPLCQNNWQVTWQILSEIIIQYHKKRNCHTSAALNAGTLLSLVFSDYEILMFPQQNLAWLKFSFGKVFYYGNERICLPAEGLTPTWAHVLTLPQSVYCTKNVIHNEELLVDYEHKHTPKLHQVTLGDTIFTTAITDDIRQYCE